MPGPTVDNSRVGEVIDEQLIGSGRGGTAAITVTASPMTYTAGAQAERVYVQAAAAATTTIAKKGTTLANMVTAAATNTTSDVLLGPGESAVITYTVAPVMAKDVP